MVGLQQLMVYAGLVIEPLQVRLGDQPDEVVVAGAVLGQQGQVIGTLIGSRFGEPALLGDVHLAADDGPDARLLALGIELDGPVEGAVVGEGKALHAQLTGPSHQRPNATKAV